MQKLPYILGGAGLAELENRYIGDNLPEPLKRINDVVGGSTGYLVSNPETRGMALASLPAKEMMLFGIGGLDKFRRSQQGLVDTNLHTAKTNLTTAALNAGNSNYLKLLALGGLLGGGGMAYYAYNHRKPTADPRFKTVSDRGRAPGSHKIRIDIPPSALPDDFLSSIASMDENPKARIRLMEKSGGILNTLGSLAGEFTGISPTIRALREGGLSAGNFAEDNNSEARRYGLSALGNAAYGLGGIGMGLLPALGYMLKQPRLAAWMNNYRKATGAGKFLGRAGEYPTFGKSIFNATFRNKLSPAQAATRRGAGLDMRGAVDRARDIKFRTDPKLFDWENPTTRSPIFKSLFSMPDKAPRSLPGRALYAGQYLGNRAINSGYGAYQLARRNPNASLFFGGMPFAGMGTVQDEMNKPAEPEMRGPRTTGIHGTPLSAVASSILSMAGHNPNSSVLDQLRGPAFDPFSGQR